MPEDRLPDYLKRSPRWKKLQSMNNDLFSISSSVFQFDKYLSKVSKKLKIKDMKTIKDESYRQFQERAERASTESPRQPPRSPAQPLEESSLDMGVEAPDGNQPSALKAEATGAQPPRS